MVCSWVVVMVQENKTTITRYDKMQRGFPSFLPKGFLPVELFKRNETTLDNILNTGIFKEIKSRRMLGAASFYSILQTIFECIQEFQGAHIF